MYIAKIIILYKQTEIQNYVSVEKLIKIIILSIELFSRTMSF